MLASTYRLLTGKLVAQFYVLIYIYHIAVQQINQVYDPINVKCVTIEQAYRDNLAGGLNNCIIGLSRGGIK